MTQKRAPMAAFDVAAACGKHGITKKMLERHFAVSYARIQRWWKRGKVPNAYLQKFKEIEANGLPEHCAQYRVVLCPDPNLLKILERIAAVLERLAPPPPPPE